MATVLHRSTPAPSLSAQKSQVTAAVLEFRCMFTHDILKKQKKWHDGCLRFHTFNKRVMVYDESKNLVGDLHYRQPEEFGEGLELKLDRPVLVQVEEPLGQTSTDLTPLLTRQKQDATTQSTPLTQPNRASLPRINAANSQVKPKSIKELLGASQGRLGRARLPLQSPFEQRHVLSETQASAEPPTKRQKLDKDKENQHAQSSVEGTQIPVVNLTVPKPVSRQAKSAPVVVDLSSDDEPNIAYLNREARKTIRTPQDCAQAISSNSNKKKTSNQQMTKTRERLGSKKSKENSQKSSSPRPSPVVTTSKVATPSQPIPELASNTSRRSRYSLVSGPRSSLRFAPENPRPKLMYKALLDATLSIHQQKRQNSQPAPNSNSLTADLDSERTLYEMRDQGGMAAADRLFNSSPPDIDEQDDNTRDLQSKPSSLHGSVEARCTPPEQRRESTSNDIDINLQQHDTEMNTAVASPLFMPCTASQVSAIQTQDPVTNYDDFCIPSSSGLPEVELKNKELRKTTAEYTYEQSQAEHSVHDATFPASSPPFPKSIQVHSVNELQGNLGNDIDLFPESNQHFGPPEKSTVAPCSDVLEASKPFRRVRSESCVADVPEPDMVSDESFESLKTSFSLVGGQPSNLKPTEVLPKSPLRHPAKLRAVASDPTVFSKPTAWDPECSNLRDDEVQRQVQQENLQNLEPHNDQRRTEQRSAEPEPGPESEPSMNAETGPWTTTEAFLLFDWWPSGRQKPDYGQDVSLDMTRKWDTISANGVTYGDKNEDRSLRTNAVSKFKYGTFGSARFVSQR